MKQHLAVLAARYWPTLIMLLILLTVGFDIYDRHRPKPVPPVAKVTIPVTSASVVGTSADSFAAFTCFSSGIGMTPCTLTAYREFTIHQKDGSVCGYVMKWKPTGRQKESDIGYDAEISGDNYFETASFNSLGAAEGWLETNGCPVW
jgi:hypothetical protein